MNVLMISRATLFSSPGGDTIQIINTAKFLRLLNVSVDIRTSDAIINYSQYDLIHFFNIIRPNDILNHITKCDLPFVVSTIFVDYSEYERNNRKGIPGFIFKYLSRDQIEYFKILARCLVNRERISSNFYLLNGHKKAIQKVALRTSCLLPNSYNEYERFERCYIAAKNYSVIPNAVDTGMFELTGQENKDFENHVICVARIEGRKNQLNVIRAILKTDYNLTIIGSSSPNHIKYFEQCRMEAGISGQVNFMSHLHQTELSSIYRAARVHVLASWFETTGLSTLEAALLGCNIVITEKGDTREYFNDYAFYCEPDKVSTIKYAIEKAYKSPFPEELRTLILTNYTWEIAAKKTLAAYKNALVASVG